MYVFIFLVLGLVHARQVVYFWATALYIYLNELFGMEWSEYTVCNENIIYCIFCSIHTHWVTTQFLLWVMSENIWKTLVYPNPNLLYFPCCLFRERNFPNYSKTLWKSPWIFGLVPLWNVLLGWAVCTVPPSLRAVCTGPFSLPWKAPFSLLAEQLFLTLAFAGNSSSPRYCPSWFTSPERYAIRLHGNHQDGVEII
jgi:hypothetical protein